MNVFSKFFEEHKFEQLHFVFAKLKEYNFYCDVSLAMDFIRGSWEYQRIMGVPRGPGSTRGSWEYQRIMGVSEEHGRDAF